MHNSSSSSLLSFNMIIVSVDVNPSIFEFQLLDYFHEYIPLLQHQPPPPIIMNMMIGKPYLPDYGLILVNL